MTVIGYARVSTTDENLDVQEGALRAAGCDLIRSEKRTGTTTAGGEELRTVLDFLRSGDVLMVTRIDRLARSIGDLQDIVRAVKAKGATLKATEQPIDTSTAAGKCFLGRDAVLEHDAAASSACSTPHARKSIGAAANSRAIDEAGSRRGRNVGAIGATGWRRASQQAGVADQ
jgi:hypothetical protein